jgi:hypothetical protein
MSPHGGHYCLCELDVGEDEVIWACACLCTGPPEGAEAAPLHNPNPTSPNPNSKNSSDLCWNFWPKFSRQTFLQVAFRCHALYKTRAPSTYEHGKREGWPVFHCYVVVRLLRHVPDHSWHFHCQTALMDILCRIF